ncbi:MarR family transcriptional regulator [Listeria grayi]|uniref:Transcriptional regulator, MarR family n=1 Tax=Listeria grayi DSM 20601 TaxID=525367 RepID=D7UVV4_LISGR|nr:MarR family transcriptional regulator [Listeria grayi]EFI84745.1 transcriptional regulator, MarR family [Listeria grayi DSM 20601]
MSKQEEVMRNIRNVFNKMVWLNKIKMEASLKDYTSSEVHCIEFIGKSTDPNVTKLAEAFYMTRGAMSKLTKKLIQKGLIETYQNPENKKEIYYKLTTQGKAVFNIHEALHQEFQERDKAVFEQVTEEQWENMLLIMDRYSQHLDEEIKKLDNKPE